MNQSGARQRWFVFQHIAQLLGDFVSHRLHGFNCGDTFDPAIKENALTLGEARGDFFGLVISAGDLDDFRAIKRRFAHFVAGGQAGEERPQLDPCACAISGVGNGDVARAGDDDRIDAHFLERRDRHRRLPIFETGGGSLPFVFDVEMLQTQIRCQRLRLDQRRAAFAQTDDVRRVVDRQHFVITPQSFRAVA